MNYRQTNGALTDRVNEMNKLFANCDTCRRTCDIGNCCRLGNAYLPDTEKVLNKKKQLTKAKEIIKELLPFAKRECVSSAKFNAKEIKKAEAFLNKE